jgi:hypothetical protein
VLIQILNSYSDSKGGHCEASFIGRSNPLFEIASLNIEIETCAPCHSRRSVIWKDYVLGKPCMDTYLPQLLEEGMYYADGQI